jgi:glycosyltransferase involved in cell wall biosynthesis
MAQRLLVVSPVRNEAAHIERVGLALAAQTRAPDQWVVIDDRSTDDTTAILARLAERLSFMTVLQSPPANESTSKDRLAIAAEARAFNNALVATPWETFTHIAKLDGDIELPKDYFESLLKTFALDPTLGLAGGVLREPEGDGWGAENPASDYHVRGALKCYTRECLLVIGGIQERLAWDTIDEVYARMHGFRTRTLPELVALHHRASASADGILRGRARHGRCLYITHYPMSWVWLRAFKTASERPRVLSGLAFLCGYLWSGMTGVKQVEDPKFRAFMRRELGARARRALRTRAPFTQVSIEMD